MQLTAVFLLWFCVMTVAGKPADEVPLIKEAMKDDGPYYDLPRARVNVKPVGRDQKPAADIPDQQAENRQSVITVSNWTLFGDELGRDNATTEHAFETGAGNTTGGHILVPATHPVQLATESTCTEADFHSGTLTNDGYGNNHYECFVFTTTHIVELSWDSFNVESHPSCGYDSITVYQNYNPNLQEGFIVDTFCGHSIPDPINIQGPFYVVIRSDFSNTGSFAMRWTSVVNQCNTVSGEGTLQSRNYPDNYDNNDYWCTVIDRQHTRLVFDSLYALEYTADCNFDYVSVTNDDITTKYCGNIPPEDATYEGEITVRFRTDRSVTQMGFSLQYLDPPVVCATESGSGIISSTNYPSSYNNNEDFCVILTAEEIELSFVGTFDIEDGGNSCRYDYVSITAGGITTRHCGRSAPSDQVYLGPVVIRFHSDGSITKAGFSLAYDDVSNDFECTRLSGSGEIETTNYPSRYPNDDDWCFTIDEESVQIQFSGDFNIEDESSCGYDYVSITTEGTTIKHCGRTPPAPAVYAGPVTIRFHSDYTATRSGFSMQYSPSSGNRGEDDCREVFDFGDVSTTNYPYMYDNNEEWCFFINEQYVTLWVNADFELENSENCVYDYVSLTVAGETTRYCGSIPPSSGKYNGPIMIRFRSDGSVKKKGFSMTYDISDDSNEDVRCGVPVIGLPSIIGGEDAERGQWPWQLMVVNLDFGVSCAATIVSSRWAITSAHCVSDGTNVASSGQLLLLAGYHELDNLRGTETVYRVSTVIPHSNYAPDSSFRNDIALLRFEQEIQFTSYIRPTCLRRAGVGEGLNCWAIGWGSISIDDVDVITPILQQAEFTTIRNSQCNYEGIRSAHLCTENRGKSTCRGDGGGPLLCPRSGSFYLQGVGSFSSTTCTDSQSVFTRVSSITSWIRSQSSYEIPVEN